MWFGESLLKQKAQQDFYSHVDKLVGPASVDEGDKDAATKPSCNKATGQKKRLQKQTRGVWFV